MGFRSRGFRLLKPALTLITVCVVALSTVGITLVVPSAGAAQSITLLRGPYVQNVTTDSAFICWEANIAHTGIVVYGDTQDYPFTVYDAKKDKNQCVKLPGLNSYTRYHYKVSGDGIELSSDASFMTLAGRNQRNLNFVAWGDNRTNHPIHQRLAGLVREASPDFVLNVGDLVETGTLKSDWDKFFELERDLLANSPVYPTLGNHELNSPLYFSLFNLPGNERWYSFNSGPAHFVALDVVFSDFHPGSEQYQWLEKDLSETSRPWKIVYLHYPPYCFGIGRGGDRQVRDALVPLFEKYGVQLVFSGHNHHYERNVVNGVTYVVTGGGGAPLYPVGVGPWTKYAEMTYQFVNVSINGRALTSTGVRLDGSEFDAFSLELTADDAAKLQPLLSLGEVTPPTSPDVPSTPNPAAGITARSSTPTLPRETSFAETLNCLQCHNPFRLNNGQLLASGWDFHRSLVIGGGAFGALALIMVLAMRRSLERKTERGACNGAQSEAYSQSRAMVPPGVEQTTGDH